MSRPLSVPATPPVVSFDLPAHPTAHPTREGAQFELHRLMTRHGRSKANRAGSRDTGYTRAGVRFCSLCGGWHAGGARRNPRARSRFGTI